MASDERRYTFLVKNTAANMAHALDYSPIFYEKWLKEAALLMNYWMESRGPETIAWRSDEELCENMGAAMDYWLAESKRLNSEHPMSKKAAS